MVKLNGLRNLIKHNSTDRICSMNVAVPMYGKDRVTAPIPFKFFCYLSEKPGDIGWRTTEGDTYDSSVYLYSLKELAVPIVTLRKNLESMDISESESEITEQILANYDDTTIFTFGFVNCNFSMYYNYKFYRFVSQRKVYNDYYVLKGELSA